MNADENAAKVLPRLSAELGISAGQVAAVAKLLKEGNTIPFIARYRKEVHGNLDEVQISKIQERLTYYAELEDRRATILKSIDEQGKLTDELREKIESCMSIKRATSLTGKRMAEGLVAPGTISRRYWGFSERSIWRSKPQALTN